MNENLTIEEARNLMRQEWLKGTTCLCCNQPVKIYRRSITSSMAYGLIALYRITFNPPPMHPKLWIHIEESFKQLDIPASVRGDVPKLRFWGLIESRSDSKEDGNPNSGFYKITPLGKDFVENKATVMSHILLYNNKMYGFAKGAIQVSIIDCLKNKFNYLELMK